METKFSADRENTENEPARIIMIDLARHSFKTKLADGREPLAEGGMEAAVQEALKNPTDIPVGKIFGSPRERTGQSSAARMFAEQLKEANFAGGDPEEFVRWLQDGGLEKTETPFLNFELGEGEYTTQLRDSVVKNNCLQWLVEKSEKAALDLKQDPKKVTPLCVQAGNVAKFFWAQAWLGYEDLKKGENLDQKMDFATSHQGVLESFLYKVIEKQDGAEAAAQFVQSLPAGGFAENQGFRAEVEILDKDDLDKWQVVIDYAGKKYLVLPADLQELMTAGDEFKKQLADNLSVK